MKPRSSFACISAVLLTLLAVALGGSVDLSRQAILAALAGLLLVIAPPRGATSATPFLLAGALFLLALAAFLPSFGILPTPWRDYLVHECHLPAATMALRTPQPWLTAQSCGLLFLGLVWGLYLLAQPWEREDRVHGSELLVFGVAFMSLLAAFAFILHFHVPGWNQQENRGWFPNRNQTADVLALTGIVNYALIFDRMRKGKRIGIFLLFALIPVVIELVISYSRAGVLLFFGGVLLWHAWPRPRHGRAHIQGMSPKALALSAALGIVLVAGFLTWGGKTLDRFTEKSTGDFSDFRGALQVDALRLSAQSPLLGVGLGNFEPLFSFSRIHSINENRAIHPESDWLWVVCEMGWPSIALIVGAYVWWMRRVLPLEKTQGETMRCAFMVSVLVFAVHGFVDVSAHRTGSLWVALLIASWALTGRGETTSVLPAPALFRVLGLLLLGLAGWWGASLAGWATPPTTATLDRLAAQIDSGNLPAAAALDDTNAGLRIAPLDWSLYLSRGVAEISLPNQTDRAQADFETARALNPYWIALTLNEGQIWSAAGQPDLAIDAWRDGLRRGGPMAHEAFRQMVGVVQLHSVERQGLAELAYDNIDYLLMLLPTATLEEADALLTHLMENDPTLHDLTEAQRTQLFDGWWNQGNQVRLMQLLHDHPEWESETWIYEARFAAKENDFQRACEIATKHALPPIIPQDTISQPVADLATEFASHPDSLSDGLLLVMAQMKSGQNVAALATLRVLAKIPDHPRYLAYLAAELFATQNDWERSWGAWQIYLQP
jgi:tetratricopeptide (TPR) repeat protein